MYVPWTVVTSGFFEMRVLGGHTVSKKVGHRDDPQIPILKTGKINGSLFYYM